MDIIIDDRYILTIIGFNEFVYRRRSVAALLYMLKVANVDSKILFIIYCNRIIYLAGCKLSVFLEICHHLLPSISTCGVPMPKIIIWLTLRDNFK
jgi:hypothetical protein